MTEDLLEQEALVWLSDVGYTPLYGPTLAPDGERPERGASVASSAIACRTPASPPIAAA